MESKKTIFSVLYDIIGDHKSSDDEKESAWQELLLIEDNIGFCVLIAAKYSWRKIPDKYKEKAWQELLKRGIENEPDNLHYLLVNATESWQEKAKKLKKN